MFDPEQTLAGKYASLPLNSRFTAGHASESPLCSSTARALIVPSSERISSSALALTGVSFSLYVHIAESTISLQVLSRNVEAAI